MALSPGSWTELVTGLSTAAIAAVLGSMAWKQGQRANRIAEAALEVQFSAESGALLLTVRCEGATVWIHSVSLTGGVAATVDGDGPHLAPAGLTGELSPQGLGPAPWRCHRGFQISFDSPFAVPPTSFIATLQIDYSLTGSGETTPYLLELGDLVAGE